MKQVAIIGFGRFGKVLYDILKDDFKIILFDVKKDAFKKTILNENSQIINNLKQVYDNDNITIFFAVPISKFETVIRKHSKYFKPNHLLIDVLSVKIWPKKVLDKYLKNTNIKAILTHPMFGPDSIQNLKNGLPFVFNKYTSTNKQYNFWTNYFKLKGFKILEMSPKKHDMLASKSQGVAHFLGRVLEDFRFKNTEIDTQGAKALYKLMTQTCNDKIQLFYDLQNYNLYTNNMRLALEKSFYNINKKLFEHRVKKEKLVFGIQGGKGSFNEQALFDYVKRHNIKNYEVKYLYTTYNVLKALSRWEIDYGLFAMHNSIGGIVEESIKALSRFKVKIQEEFAIKIEHFLMKRKDVDFKNIDTIMTHPQVLKQCKNNLSSKYANFKKGSGEGDLIDHAKVAEAMSLGKLPHNIAVMGPKILADLYGLDIIDGPLQDSKNNLTSFLMVVNIFL